MTTTMLLVLLGLAAFLIGTLAMRGNGAANATPARRAARDVNDAKAIDPDDAHQLAQLAHLAPGTDFDERAARVALSRFEAEHGRRATTRDVDALVGLMRDSSG